MHNSYLVFVPSINLHSAIGFELFSFQICLVGKDMLSSYHHKLGQNTTPHHVKKTFRELSRKVIKTPQNKHYHELRIQSALQFYESEPIQGALVDYFYACWYDIGLADISLLKEAQPKLGAQVYQQLLSYIDRAAFMPRNTTLATSWSVLATPSLQVATHRLRTSRDHSSYVVDAVIEKLLVARDNQDGELIERIEEEFFSHCLVCFDKVAFMTVWFRLNKANWIFDKRWRQFHESLEVLNNNVA